MRELGVVIAVFLAVALTVSPAFGMGGLRAKASRTLTVSAPLGSGFKLTAATKNGSITATAGAAGQCKVTATVAARAMAKERAEKLAAETNVTLVSDGGAMTVKTDAPSHGRLESIAVDLAVEAPADTQLDLTSYNGEISVAKMAAAVSAESRNGAISCADVTGNADLATANGRIDCERLKGDLQAKTSNGEIVCREISGSVRVMSSNGAINCQGMSGGVRAETRNGKVRVSYSKSAPAAPEVTLISSNGAITFEAPSGFSAEAVISTHNGSIKSDLPLTVKSKSRHELTGTYGDGKGKLGIETHNGSVRVQ